LAFHSNCPIMCQSEVKRRIGRKSRVFIPLHSTRALWGSSSEYCDNVWCGETRILWLPDSENFFMICAAVSTQYRRVRDGRTERRTDSLRQYSLRYAYASRGKNYPIFMKFCRTMHILTATTVN